MSAGDEIQLVTFSIEGHEFGFNVFEVERVLRYEAPTPLPNAPEYLEGTLRYGDDVVPVIDLRKRVGAPAPIRDETRIVIIEWGEGRIGVVVDVVLEVLRVPADRVKPPPTVIKRLTAEYITGIVSTGERTLVMLAAAKLLSSTERVALDALTAELPNV